MLSPQIFSHVQLLCLSLSLFDLDKLQDNTAVPLENKIRSIRNRSGLAGSSLHLFPVSEHWDYHPHPHSHPVEFENLPETNFTELQSVQALHPPCHPVRYETENLIDPNLGAHPHVLQQSVSPPVGQA